MPTDIPVGARIGIIAALPGEVSGLLSSLDVLDRSSAGGLSIQKGMYEGKDIIVLISGVGLKKARTAIRTLINHHHPDLILSAGFAGGLDPSLGLGDAIVPSRIVDHTGLGIDTPPDIHKKLLNARPTAHAGTILTTPRFIAEESEKAALFQRHDARAVDMESAAIAAEAHAAGFPHLALRVISDTADQTLPPLSRFLDASGEVMPIRAALYFLRRPTKLIPTLRFYTGMSHAAGVLTDLLVTAITVLP